MRGNHVTSSGTHSNVNRRVILAAVMRTHRQYVGDLDRLDDAEVEKLIDYWSAEPTRNARRVRAAQGLIARGELSAASLAALETADLFALLDGSDGSTR